MSIEENKDIARRFIQIWGNGDLNVIDELSAPSLTVQYPVLPKVIKGKDTFKRVMESFRSAFPDSSLQIDDEIAENDRVVLRWTFSGTHKGIMLGIPASHKKVIWTGITIYKIVEGKIVQEIGEEDYLGFLRQIGIVQKP